MPRRYYKGLEIRRRRRQLKAARANLIATLAEDNIDCRSDDDEDDNRHDIESDYNEEDDDRDVSYDADSSDSDSDSDESDIVNAIALYIQSKNDVDDAVSQRYLAPRICRKSNLNIFEEDLDPDAVYYTNRRRFKNRYRCTRESLEFIANEVKDHPIFQRGRAGPKQAPIKHQLMTLFHYMGHEGITNDDQGGIFRIGAGTSELYRSRAITAILSLKKKYVRWPDADEREEISQRFKRRYDCPNCVGQADGTLVELVFAPQTPDAPDYHGRKMKWSLTLLIVGDDRRFVRYYLSGFPGCAHDNRVWKWSKLYQHMDDYFSPSEYIITDTAYEPCPVIVPAYKSGEAGVADSPKKLHFNKKLGTPRETIEHINGMLKGRYPGAMRRIRKVIKDKESLREILELIDCAMILHNILLKLKDGDNDDWREWHDSDDDLSDMDDPGRGDPDEDVSPEEHVMNCPIPFGSEKDCRRIQLADYLWEHAVENSGDYTDDNMSVSSLSSDDNEMNE